MGATLWRGASQSIAEAGKNNTGGKERLIFFKKNILQISITEANLWK
jgi:hypothetical protein